jgi:hypothetical protein
MRVHFSNLSGAAVSVAGSEGRKHHDSKSNQ